MIADVIAGTRVALGRGGPAVQLPLLVHIAAGLLGIATGFIALAAAKGARLHRQIGMRFVHAMLVMALTAAGIATYEAKLSSVRGGLMTAYFVVTALTAVRPRTVSTRRIEIGAMIVVLAVGLSNITLGLASVLAGARMRDGVPAPVHLFFGAIALAAALADVRVIRQGGLRGAPRLARHLWRMCFALFIATGSFFLGQAHLIPKPLRIYGLLAIPALAPLVAMAYWLWRVRARRTPRGIAVHIPTAEAA